MNGDTATGHKAPVVGTVVGAKVAVGQPNGTTKGAGVVGKRPGIGAVGAKVGIGVVGATVGIGAVGATVGVKVGTGAVGKIVGAMVGVKKVGVKAVVGAKVEVRPHITPGKAAPPKGNVGTVVGAKVAVGQNARPVGAVTVGAKGRVGAAKRGVIPGARVGAVGSVVNGGIIMAKPFDEKRLITIIKNKLMKKNLTDLILNLP